MHFRRKGWTQSSIIALNATHPLTGKEIRALRQLRRENLQSRHVFNTERGGPVTRAWLLKMVRRTGELAKLAFPIHPHMLRHGCGFKLANDGVDTRALQHFLGHRNITHMVRYTELRSTASMGSGRTDLPRTSHEACASDAPGQVHRIARPFGDLSSRAKRRR